VGHFERGGTMRMRQAELLVERVVLYRTLTGEPVQQAVAHYQPVGRFLVKLIDSRPDFDHIVLLERALAAPVAVPKHGVDENLAELAQRAPYAGTVYYETADLR
jgi:hypothetical protein